MKRISKRRRRSWILSVTDSLEVRVTMSSIGQATPSLSPALVGTMPSLGRESVRPSRPLAYLTDRLAIHGRTRPLNAAASPTVRRWSWLANTYWYVPTANLPAVLYNSTTNTLAPVSDQTVFQITGYREGYFWGKTVTQLGSSSASGSSLVGSITPQGRVLLTFTQTSGDSSPTITEGFGEMQRKCRQWTMENQMFTSPSQTLQIGHWAYMVQTHPGLPSWYSLPSAGISVPAFLNQSEGSGPEPIGP